MEVGGGGGGRGGIKEREFGLFGWWVSFIQLSRFVDGGGGGRGEGKQNLGLRDRIQIANKLRLDRFRWIFFRTGIYITTFTSLFF